MEQLSPGMIETGRSLLDLLEKDGIPIDTALWRRDKDNLRWELMFVTLDVRKGPMPLYQKASRHLARMGEPPERLFQVAFVDPLSTRDLPAAPAARARRLIGRHLVDESVGDAWLVEAYIYKLASRTRRRAHA